MYFGTHIISHVVMFGWMVLSVYYFTVQWDSMVDDDEGCHFVTRMIAMPIVMLFAVVSVAIFNLIILYLAIYDFRYRLHFR